nr:MAG TPA: hypothetical protein [Bacteriophage sp.]
MLFHHRTESLVQQHLEYRILIHLYHPLKFLLLFHLNKLYLQ